MKHAARPKWAKPLTARQWKALKVCQNTQRPTLSQLRDHVRYQQAHDLHCHDCKAALDAVTDAFITTH